MNDATLSNGPLSSASACILTADDFAMTAGVSRAIVELIEAGKISAAGAMTNRPHWADWAGEFVKLKGKADLGVHINLTMGAPLTSMTGFAPAELPDLRAILKASLFRLLPIAEIRAEIDAQLQAFEDRMGVAPDFADGHQHVHALPGVRVALLQALIRRYPGKRPYIRDPSDTVPAILKRRVQAGKALGVAWLARGFGAAAARAGFETNDGFAGFSSFAAEGDYAGDFKSYLVAPGERHLIMCHPGHIDDELKRVDPAVESRQREFRFLMAGALKPSRFARTG